MRLTEQQAAKTVLVRSIEECDATAFSSDALAAAIEAAKDERPGLGWVEKRAAYLFDHLADGYRRVLEIAKLPSPWTLPACAVALIIGLTTNLLGPAEKIHVIRNPVFVLVAWNLLIYFAAFAMFVFRMISRSAAAVKRSSQSDPRARTHSHAKQSAKEVPWLNRLLLPRAWRMARDSKLGAREAKILPGLVARYAANWFIVARPLVNARWKRLLHLGALCLAVGAVAGMYGRGLFQDYEVVWTSTFVRRQETVSTFVGLLFGPSLWVANLLGLRLAGDIDVARLLSGEGDRADAWIHLFAITVLIAVVIPRASLAIWQSLRIRKWRRALALPVDAYYVQVMEPPLRAAIEGAIAAAGKKFSENVAAFISTQLYDQQITPALHRFREQGGRLVDLRSEVAKLSEAFLPNLNAHITGAAVPRLQIDVSQRVGEIVKSIGTDFVRLGNTDQVVPDLQISAARTAEIGVATSVTKALGISIGTVVSVALATIGGGIGHHLGLAIIATLLGTTGPVGFLIGLLMGAVATAGAWLFGREKLTGAIENFSLPAPIVRTALWESRFEKVLEEGRKKFEQSAQENVTEKLNAIVPPVADQILTRVRMSWAS